MGRRTLLFCIKYFPHVILGLLSAGTGVGLIRAVYDIHGIVEIKILPKMSSSSSLMEFCCFAFSCSLAA